MTELTIRTRQSSSACVHCNCNPACAIEGDEHATADGTGATSMLRTPPSPKRRRISHSSSSLSPSSSTLSFSSVPSLFPTSGRLAGSGFHSRIIALAFLASCGLTCVTSQGFKAFDTGWETNVTDGKVHGALKTRGNSWGWRVGGRERGVTKINVCSRGGRK
ncbi:hypothetical protein PoB_001522100 [Plakobranchus ocellatus]|uniref:Uncharacterized protein n=1 Tax=Plakobranchus ocellatus TaxID=259542 RepID=A0AAV3YN94_9GAST|nr:hypothetical protein PoB_001522100 [Plakobranchus ocellatus]